MSDMVWFALVIGAAVMGWLYGDEHGEKRVRREWINAERRAADNARWDEND